MEEIISEHILDCYKYRSNLNGTINQLLKFIPDENFTSLKEKLIHFDIDVIWCREFWKKYQEKIIDILNKNDGIMLFSEVLFEIQFTKDLNTSVFTVNVPSEFEFSKDIVGVWISNKSN